MYRKVVVIISSLCLLLLMTIQVSAATSVSIKIEKSKVGAPITIGIPFAKGSLLSPDHVRVLNNNGEELPSQSTQVNTWEPADYSVKWLWVFFFSTGDEEYTLEYGPDVRRAPITGPTIMIKNAQRTGQTSYVQTGTLSFAINKKNGGFIDNVLFDVDNDGISSEDTIAIAPHHRGSFLDLIDDLGIDNSMAVIHRTVREKGSGPLHAIIRLEGTYTYSRPDNRDSPFIIRIHLYAGKSYIKVYHTLTYTGIPDQHEVIKGQHANIALSDHDDLLDDSESYDIGWMQPNDQIAATGLSLNYRLGAETRFKSGYKSGSWYDSTEEQVFEAITENDELFSVFQSGPKPDRISPVPNSTADVRIDGFEATISSNNRKIVEVERLEGWADISDDRWGVSVGIRNFLEEYPKEIAFDQDQNLFNAYTWSPKAGPMSFARADNKRDQGMIANFAEGITKTSELIIYFHDSDVSTKEIKRTMDYVLDPSIPSADPQVYSDSEVYGHFSPRGESFQGLERSLDYKFDWQLFNQKWEPWYGMFDYGDQKNSYFNEEWYRWQNNEPAIDLMYWLQFMRTGDSKYYLAAEAMSRHTMDVDNVHWPTDPTYYGDTNDAIDYWNIKEADSKATPYLGIGRRHAKQHWSALLSAHVWSQGWLASYYLTGYHRGLDVAKLTADSYLRRIWGDHDLRGRRLYLSVWNLVGTWDATKDPKYLKEINDRLDIMIDLQNGADQYGSLVIDRYGYSQIYASHSLYQYYQMTNDQRVKQSLLTHARAVRDNPPFNHEYESLLASIHPLVVGYELSGEKSFFNEAKMRSKVMYSDKMKMSFSQLGTPRKISEELIKVSNLPQSGNFRKRRSKWPTNWSPTHGLRVFGWTHMYNVPWLLDSLRKEKEKKE